MRREGYEFQVSMPRVVFKEIDGKNMNLLTALFWTFQKIALALL